MKKYTRQDLIQICIDSIVPHQKWDDRDSHCAQRNIQSIYQGLTGGVKYKYEIQGDTISIIFEKPTEKQKSKFEYIDIDSREDYMEWYKKEYGDEYIPEMFEGYGIDWNEDFLSGYMPTRERLEKRSGEDWY